MARVRVGESGDVQLPVEIRDALGLKTGDVVDMRLRSEGVVELRRASAAGDQPRKPSVLDLAGMLRPPKGGVTLEDMERAIAEGAAAHVGPRHRR